MGPAGMKWRWYWGIWALMGLYMATWDLAMYPSAPALRNLVLNLLQNGTWAVNLRALVVDDEALARQRIRHLLRRSTDIEVMGECANGLEAVKAIEELASPERFTRRWNGRADGAGTLGQSLDRTWKP